jgi:hypothetical protein
VQPARATTLQGQAVGLTPWGHLNHLDQGVRYPLGLCNTLNLGV